MSELKPCPFCGCSLIATLRDKNGLQMICPNCEARGPRETSKKQHFVEYLWNHRCSDERHIDQEND